MESTEKKATNDFFEISASNLNIKTDLSAERTLKIIASIVLVVGIIATIILLTTTVWVDIGVGIKHVVFNPSALVITIGVLLSTLISWALLRVLANISINLKNINSKM